MHKKCAVILSLLVLGACDAKRDGPDWASDCDRNFSVSSREHAECTARVEASREQKRADAAGEPGVGLTRAGSEVGPYEGGKELERGERG